MTQSLNLKRYFIKFVFIASLILAPALMISAYEAENPSDGTIPCNSNNPRDCEINRPSSGGGGGGSTPRGEDPEEGDFQPVAYAEVTVYVDGGTPTDPTTQKPTGTIFADRSSCVIEDGGNTCNAKFTWNVTNPDPEKVATVYRHPVAGPVIERNSGSEILPVYYWLDSDFNTSRYILYIDKLFKTIDAEGDSVTERGLILGQAFVKATCKVGSSWVSSLSKCVKNVTVDNFSTPNCTIPLGGNSCTSTISWSVSGGYGDFAVTTQNNPSVGTGTTGSKPYTIEYPSRSFYLYNNGNQLSSSISYADCAEESVWSSLEKKCVKKPIIIECTNGATNPPQCDTCAPGTTWNEQTGKCICNNGATNPPQCSTCALGTTWNAQTEKCVCDNGATNPPDCDTIVECTNGATNPPQCSTCALGTTWNEQTGKCLCNNGATNPPVCDTIIKCTNGASNPPQCDDYGKSAQLHVENCIIPTNGNSCSTSLSWSNSLPGSFAITTPEEITVSTLSSASGFPYTVEYPSRKFFAYNNGNLIDEKIAYAQCDSEKDIWSNIHNKCMPKIVVSCPEPIVRVIESSCPSGQIGKMEWKQTKEFSECAFSDNPNESNSILLNNNCRLDDGSGEPQWIETSCDDVCGAGVEQISCTLACDTDPSTGKYCPGDTDGDGKGTVIKNCVVPGGSGETLLDIEIKAIPEKIIKGRTSTLSWTANADSCKASKDSGYEYFETGDKSNGSFVVKPAKTATYKIDCTRGEITESKTLQIRVTNVNIIEI